MRIVIIGGGNVGSTLARRWASAGHQIIVGVRDPEKSSALREHGVHVVNIGDALAGDADAVMLAVTGSALEQLVTEHASALDGHLILDATNNPTGPTLHQVPMLQRLLPNATIVRAFNTLGWDVMAEPEIQGVTSDLLYACDDGEQRAVVASLVRDVGMRPIWIGDLTTSDALDGLTHAWFALVFGRGFGRHLAFAVQADIDPTT